MRKRLLHYLRSIEATPTARVDEKLFNALVEACAEAKDRERAFQVFGMLKERTRLGSHIQHSHRYRRGVFQIRRCVQHIHRYAAGRCQAYAVYFHLSLEGLRELTGSCLLRESNENLLKMMEGHNVTPDDSILNSFVKVCVSQEHPEAVALIDQFGYRSIN